MLQLSIRSYGLTQVALDMKAEVIQSLEGAITVWTCVQFKGCLIKSITCFLKKTKKHAKTIRNQVIKLCVQIMIATSQQALLRVSSNVSRADLLMLNVTGRRTA